MKSPIFMLSLLFAGTLAADDREALKFFENQVRPLLAERCFECHGAEKQKGGLRLDHISHVRRGGDSGAVVVPGKPEASLLVQAVRWSDPDLEMPPKEKLDDSQIAALETWIKAGAPWPKSDVVAGGEVDERGFSAEDYAWWAIQPVTDPNIPKAGETWARNPVDRFIARKLAAANLEPAPEADRRELVRRAYFDLHGLPPTPEQIATFLADQRPDAYERLIDELLASPRYGERWAQHWLDVVRYAESDGYRADDFRPGTWKYRDYVIGSLNADKPYDQFVREQLAADEFAAGDPDTLIATAFLRLGIYEWNQRNARMHWDIIMTEMTNVTAEAFLGIGIGCAQCHDHKFDPILQRDHYALRAFLSSVWWPENHQLATPEQLAAYQKKQAEWEAATAKIRAKIREIQQPKLDGDQKYTVRQFPADIQEIYAKPAAERTAYEEQLAQLVQRQVDHKWRRIKWETELKKKDDGRLERYQALTAELRKFDHLKPETPPNGFIATDVKTRPAATFLAKRSGKEAVEPAFLTLLGQPAPEIAPTASTTGRRRALADWIASENNPLSTRVIVNRIWQHHFGRGIVPTPNDFGTLGEPPSHPELLDWLTSRFLDGGWRFKELHRIITTSAAYRQTARREPGEAENLVDPGNRLLWRFPPRRLDAEQVRDATLAASGELKHRLGGASVDGTSPNRSIYVKKRRNTPDKVLNGFDAPLGFDSAPSRAQTTTPTQSLLLVNGDWTVQRARALAKRLLGGSQKVGPAQISRAFQLVYGRDPVESEIRLALGFIQAQSGEASPEPAAAPDKFPNETGLRPIGQAFSAVKGLDLGSNALWLQPGSRFERLHLAGTELDDDAFTVEAIANLDNIHRDASVNTLVSRWNGSHGSPGWTLGVTSAKSRYTPQNLIVQLVGKNVAGGTDYEVVASGLRVPLRTPVYVAASIKAADMGNVGGTVTFYLKNLADPQAKLEIREVPHSIAAGIQHGPTRLLTGGRDQNGHLWDGQLARLAISRGEVKSDSLLVSRKTGERLVDFDFDAENGEKPAPGAVWHRPKKQASPPVSRELRALTDFCHALLNSNEFLYLH